MLTERDGENARKPTGPAEGAICARGEAYSGTAQLSQVLAQVSRVMGTIHDL